MTIDAPLIRTFHPRRGRIGINQADALTRLWPSHGFLIGTEDDYGLGPGAAPFSPDGRFDRELLFRRYAPLVLEIGSGMGDATIEMAAADPARDYLAADVHTPGLGNLLARAEQLGLTNVRAARGDAVELLRDHIAPGSLAAIHVFFPDPWPKARHHKRRIIAPATVALMRDRLEPGGILHTATDWAEYGTRMAEVLAADPELEAAEPSRPRPVTKYERRGVDAGREIRDCVVRRVPSTH